MNNEKILDISWGTILKISVAILSFYVLYQIRDVLVWFIFGLIISLLFNPTINFLRKLKIPRVLAVIFVYVGVFGFFSLLIYLIIPIFVSEIQQFSKILPQYFEKISPPLKGMGIQAFENIESFVNILGGALDRIAANIFNVLFVIFGGIFKTIFILTIAIFLSLEEKTIEKSLNLLFPKKYEDYALSLWRRCQKKVSGWFLIRILTCLFVGAATFAVLLLFNIRYPASLGLFAGILNFIPYQGPLITAVLLFVIISLESVYKAVFVLIVFILIQQIENSILTPVLSKKIIGLSPVLVLMSMAIGGVLWGFLGAILAVPLAGILFEFLKDFLKKKKEEEATVVL
ncbi:AI-2E family transporter [Patescibacteria group bacterium]|nr:AI-2E family transporter [Patescibacteria group bacterium]